MFSRFRPAAFVDVGRAWFGGNRAGEFNHCCGADFGSTDHFGVNHNYFACRNTSPKQRGRSDGSVRRT